MVDVASGVRLSVGEGVVPVAVTVKVVDAVAVGVTRVSGASERATKPTQ
jgi:hypothetical protein